MKKQQAKRLGILLMTLVMLGSFAVQAFAMQIHVQLDDGSSLVLEVEPTDSSDSVLAKLEDKIGIARNLYQLFFGEVELLEGTTLLEYNVQTGDTLELRERSQVNLKVQIGGEEIYFRIKLTTVLSKLITAVAKRAGVDAGRLSLKFGDVTIDPGKTAADYGLKDGDALDAVIDTSIAITVQDGSETYPITAEPTDTVASLKAQLALVLRVEAARLALALNDTVLEDSKTLAEYEIEDGSTLQLTIQADPDDPEDPEDPDNPEDPDEPTCWEKIQQKVCGFFMRIYNWFVDLFAKIRSWLKLA